MTMISLVNSATIFAHAMLNSVVLDECEITGTKIKYKGKPYAEIGKSGFSPQKGHFLLRHDRSGIVTHTQW